MKCEMIIAIRLLPFQGLQTLAGNPKRSKVPKSAHAACTLRPARRSRYTTRHANLRSPIAHGTLSIRVRIAH